MAYGPPQDPIEDYENIDTYNDVQTATIDIIGGEREERWFIVTPELAKLAHWGAYQRYLERIYLKSPVTVTREDLPDGRIKVVLSW